MAEIAAPLSFATDAVAGTLRRMTATTRDVTAFGFLYAQLLITLRIVPDWSPVHIAEPVYLASVAAVATAVSITLIRLSGRRGAWIERLLLASFLGGMPLVYVLSWMLSPQPGWLPIELVGVVLFGSAALLGMSRSAWFLAAGIAAHGLFWDLWHYDHTTFIPNWYTIGCLIADVGIGVYAALQAPAFDAGDNRGSTRQGLAAAATSA